jgi:hypothetical protein
LLTRFKYTRRFRHIRHNRYAERAAAFAVTAICAVAPTARQTQIMRAQRRWDAPGMTVETRDIKILIHSRDIDPRRTWLAVAAIDAAPSEIIPDRVQNL